MFFLTWVNIKVKFPIIWNSLKTIQRIKLRRTKFNSVKNTSKESKSNFKTVTNPFNKTQFPLLSIKTCVSSWALTISKWQWKKLSPIHLPKKTRSPLRTLPPPCWSYGDSTKAKAVRLKTCPTFPTPELYWTFLLMSGRKWKKDSRWSWKTSGGRSVQRSLWYGE